VAVSVPRASHLIFCTSRVPSSKDMCFSRVLTGVAVLDPENFVWLLLACRWWQEKHSQLSQSYWRPRGPGLGCPRALWWEEGLWWEQGDRRRDGESRRAQWGAPVPACSLLASLAEGSRRHPGLLHAACWATEIYLYTSQMENSHAEFTLI